MWGDRYLWELLLKQSAFPGFLDASSVFMKIPSQLSVKSNPGQVPVVITKKLLAIVAARRAASQ